MKDTAALILNPSCSEWVGRFNNRKYNDEYKEYTDEKGEKCKELVNTDDDVYIDTSSFPNDGLSQAIRCLNKGFDIDDIEWENQGGGASGDTLEKDFKFARIVVDNNLKLDSEEIDILDGFIWSDFEDVKNDEIDKVFSKIPKGKIDNFAIKLVRVNSNLGKSLLKVSMLKQKTKDEITKILVTNRLEGKDED